MTDRDVTDMEDQAYRFLDSVYSEIRNHLDDSMKSRNWCVTVWMAALAAVAYGKIELNEYQKIILPLAPIFVFWIVEAFHHTFAVLHIRLAERVETALAENKLNTLKKNELFLIIAFRQYSAGRKIDALIKSLFVRESVIFFYLLLTIITFVFIFGAGESV